MLRKKRRNEAKRARFFAPFLAWLALGFGLFSFAGGCSPSATDICDIKCNCEGCSDAEYDDCVADIEDTTKKAKDFGCSDQYADWLTCIDKEAECRNGDTFAWDGCEIEEDALSACGGGDACAAAAKKLCDECNFSCADPDPSTCTGTYECQSKCIVNATCTEIASPSPGTAYFDCITSC